MVELLWMKFEFQIGFNHRSIISYSTHPELFRTKSNSITTLSLTVATVRVAFQENRFYQNYIYPAVTGTHHTHIPCAAGKAAFVCSLPGCTEKQLYISDPVSRALPGPCATAAGWWGPEPRTPVLQSAPLRLAGHFGKCESDKFKDRIIQELSFSLNWSTKICWTTVQLAWGYGHVLNTMLSIPVQKYGFVISNLQNRFCISELYASDGISKNKVRNEQDPLQPAGTNSTCVWSAACCSCKRISQSRQASPSPYFQMIVGFGSSPLFLNTETFCHAVL